MFYKMLKVVVDVMYYGFMLWAIIAILIGLADNISVIN